MQSIVQSFDGKRCFMCGTTSRIERHHIFGGAYRKKSEREGLVVYLCHECHNEPPNGVHHNRSNMDWLRAIGQKSWMGHYGKTADDFIKEYGRNYI
jgi:hypothetical protein|nr:MAG TPA: Recombination enhancement, RecA-dependent nuclease [Caudoviricetes sp.]